MSSYQDTLQQGATVGCYQIEEVLGRGGFAVTYLAIDRNLDVYVAIKEYLPREIIARDASGMVQPRESEFAEDYQVGLENFAREAKTLALFKHPNIVRVHQVLHENNTAYMVMDYEHGQELAEVLETHGSLAEEDIRAYLEPVLDAVDEIHRQGYVHRDIKPSNIYLRDNGSPVLLDFGAARYTMSETTQQLTAVVTVGYTPIEQYNVSDADQGPWTDIYALAAVMYEAITGEMPVDSVTRASTALTNAEDPLVPVQNKSRHPGSTPFFEAIDWGLRMDTEERPRSINEWLDALNGTVQPNAPVAASSAERGVAAAAGIAATTGFAATSAARHEADEVEAGEVTVNKVAASANTESGAPKGNAALSSADGTASAKTPPKPAAQRPRKSKLRTRSTTIAAAETDPEQRRTSVEMVMQDVDMEHYPDVRIEPSFSEALDDEDIPVLDRDATMRRPDSGLPMKPSPRPASARTEGTIADAPSLEDNYRSDDIKAVAAQLSENNNGKTHTQQIRDVVRRDIMKRDVDTEAEPTEALQTESEPADSFTPPQPDAPQRTGRILTRGNAGLRSDAVAPGRHTDANDFDNRPEAMEFDESDWDYEPPTPSRWKWLLPAAGLAAVFAASMVYVNRPDLFRFNDSHLPELTIDSALAQAQQQVDTGNLIFPAGESALDYYQLVLGSEPNNAQALAGVRLIEQQVRDSIVQNVEDNSLSEANRLLSRANRAGLRVDNIPATGSAGDTAVESTSVTAIDQELSPYLKDQLANIERQIELGDADAAQALFAETDKYLPDTAMADALQARIQALRSGSRETAIAGDSEIRLEPLDSGSAADQVPAITDATQATVGKPYPNTEIPASRPTAESPDTTDEQPVVEDTQAASPSTDDTDAVAEPVAATDPPTSETTAAPAPEPAAPVSAPRRSYIDGRGESARHLNQLRTAIESKNINQVLQVSDNLPSERVDFLRQMFNRYDRIDVIIDRIRDQSGQLSANLNVSMFNQRNDGSFYSAGRWNGVTVRSTSVDGQWQKIEW